jgi:hypothetical protein
MKKMILVLIIIVVFSYCTKDLSPKVSLYKFREIAWNSLSDRQRETVISDWMDAHTESCTYWENNQKAICVIFNTTEDALLGPIIVYIDHNSLEVIEFQPRK